MRRSSSTFASAALAVALALVPKLAVAQACCASPSGFAPARLRPGEDALVGFVASAGVVTGSFGRDRSFAAPSSGTRELDFAERLFVAWAPWDRLELAFTVPIVETERRAGAVTDAGGGVGDLRLGSRWTLSHLGTKGFGPRVQLLGAVSVPSGTPGDAATRPLATDASGAGAFQWESGVALEHVFGRFLVSVNGAVVWRAPRTVHGESVQLGPLFSGFVAMSYSFPSEISLGFTAGYEASLEAKSGGAVAADSATAKLTLGVSGSFRLARGLRGTAGLSFAPPVDGMGKNELAQVTGTVGLVWAWGRPSSCPMHPTTPDCGCPH